MCCTYYYENESLNSNSEYKGVGCRNVDTSQVDFDILYVNSNTSIAMFCYLDVLKQGQLQYLKHFMQTI